MTLVTHTFFLSLVVEVYAKNIYIFQLVEGNGNPLQNPCLENLMDRGTWWIAVHGIAESGTTERLTHTHTSILK